MQNNLPDNAEDLVTEEPADETVTPVKNDTDSNPPSETPAESPHVTEPNSTFLAVAAEHAQNFAAKYYPKCKELAIAAFSFCKANLKKLAKKLESYSTPNNGNTTLNGIENHTQNTAESTVSCDLPDGTEDGISYIVREVPYTFPNSGQNTMYYGYTNNMQYNISNYPPNNAANAQYGAQNIQQNVPYSAQRHNIPKCTCCGYVGPWKLEPLIRPMDWVIGIVLTFLGCGTGLI